MATKSSISINYTTAEGKKGQKAITDINPDAANAALKTFAQKVNALTTNNYIGTSRVDKTPLKSASTLRQPYIVTFDACGRRENVSSIPYSQVQTCMSENSGYAIWTIDFVHDGIPFVKSTPENSTAVIVNYNPVENLPEGDPPYDSCSNMEVSLVIPSNDPSCLGDFVIGFPETEKFAAGQIKLTITGEV